MGKTLAALRLGGLIDENDRWIGGSTTAVQVGDQLDRGGNEVEIMFLLERLRKEAAEAGGQLIVMNGNHETMNVAGRFRYSTPSGLREFQVGEGARARARVPWARASVALRRVLSGLLISCCPPQMWHLRQHLGASLKGRCGLAPVRLLSNLHRTRGRSFLADGTRCRAI